MTTEQKIILITGANKGIGFEASRALGRAGHTVLMGARDEHRGAEAAATLAAEGLEARFVRLDVTDQETVKQAAARVDREYGRLDILVNNAAITLDRPYKPSEMPVERLRETYETNVLGVVAVTNAMLPLLRRSRAAHIANVSSGLGTVGMLSNPGSEWRRYALLLGYNSSKAALNAITMIYAAELAGEGIRVNAVSPGFCATDLNNHTGRDTAAQGGERTAEQALSTGGTGVFLSELGGTIPW
jgi:NAD(P)-dependent dehydrogenase (short-subunit alcohol dehydrogenase family)